MLIERQQRATQYRRIEHIPSLHRYISTEIRQQRQYLAIKLRPQAGPRRTPALTPEITRRQRDQGNAPRLDQVQIPIGSRAVASRPIDEHELQPRIKPTRVDRRQHCFEHPQRARAVRRREPSHAQRHGLKPEPSTTVTRHHGRFLWSSSSASATSAAFASEAPLAP